MFPPYPNELYHLLGSMYGTTDPTTVVTVTGDRDHGPSTKLKETIQNPTAAQLAATDISLQPMPTSYPYGPYYASDLIYRTENRTVGALPVLAANEYHDLSAEFEDVMQTPDDAQLGSAQIPPTAPQSAQASCPLALCHWHDASGICGAMLSCEGVPAHFKYVHDIKNLNEFESVDCRWEGCSKKKMGRKNFVRHVRERHLNHSRDNGHSA